MHNPAISHSRTAKATPPPAPSAISVLKPLVRPFKENWGKVLITMFAGWGKFMLPLAIPWASKAIIDDVLMPAGIPVDERISAMLGWFTFAGAAVVLFFFASYIRVRLGQTVNANIQHSLRERVFHHLQRLSMDFFAKHHAGSLGSRVSSDINYAGMLVDMGIIRNSMDVATILLISVMLIAVNPILAVAVFITVAMSGITLYFCAPILRRRQKEIQERQSLITGHAAEIFAGIDLEAVS